MQTLIPHDLSIIWPVTVMRRLLNALAGNSTTYDDVGGVVLCAGTGRRMGALTESRPKPLLPLLNCPLLWWNLVRMRREVQRVAMNVHYLHEAFTPLPEICRESDIEVKLVYEPLLTGPFGGVLACRRELAAVNYLLVFAGDGLYEADFSGILARHREQDAELTMGVAAVDDGSRYGVVSTDSKGRVTHMREKPTGVGPVQDASCGIYVVSKKLFARFSESALSLDWIHVVLTLLEKGALVVTARVDEWHDLGTQNDLLRANMDLLASDRISLVAKEIETPEASVWLQGEHQADHSGVTFEGRVLVGTDANIGSGAIIGNSVVGSGVRIEADARVYNAVILPGGRVPAGTTVVGTVWS